jgi:monoamine oxidase
VQALGKEFGIGTFKTYNEGENIYWADGTALRFSDTSPLGSAPPDPQIIADLAVVIARLDEMAKAIPVDAPWEAANAAELDSQNFEEWVRQNSLTPRFREVAALACRPIFGAEPRELSLLFVLFYIASSGDEKNVGTFERNFNTRNGAQESRFVGGSQKICLEVAKALGRQVVRNSPVRQIRYDGKSVSVISDRLNVKARRVIVAVPPVLAGRIDYTPGLPAQRDGLTQRIAQGTLQKVTAVYDKPFWREKGLTGQALSLEGPVAATFDDSPPDGSPGVVFGFVGGDDARRFATASPAERRAAVLKNFTDWFGPEAANPVDYFETNWPAERWSRGGPVGIAAPGVYTNYGPALKKPVGRIHWGGTETSNYWNGYMDGAVRSGERVAREVLEAL